MDGTLTDENGDANVFIGTGTAYHPSMEIDLHPLGDAHFDAAFALATEVFVARSVLHRALDVGLAEYRRYLAPSFAAMIAEGLSVVAVERRTGAVVGCLVAGDYRTPPVACEAPPRLAPLGALMADLRRRYECRRGPAPGEAMLVDMAAVAGGATGHGLYRRMREAVHERGRKSGFRMVIGEATSTATQHVLLNRLGHRRMAEIPFREFTHEGAHPFAAIVDPPSIVLAEGDL